MESLTSGTLAGTGSFRCEICGHVITLTSGGVLPACPGCDGATFTRASLFNTGTFNSGARFTRVPAESGAAGNDADLDAAGDALEQAGRFLVFHDAGEVRTVPIPVESMRIGRSLAAELRFEDPTVSRRHAVLLIEAGGVRVLDDRSLNGVFINGERVVSQLLCDGDEVVIGRYRLRFIERAGVAAQTSAGALRGQ